MTGLQAIILKSTEKHNLHWSVGLQTLVCTAHLQSDGAGRHKNTTIPGH